MKLELRHVRRGKLIVLHALCDGAVFRARHIDMDRIPKSRADLHFAESVAACVEIDAVRPVACRAVAEPDAAGYIYNGIRRIFGRVINRAAPFITTVAAGIALKNAAADISRGATRSGVIDRPASAGGRIVLEGSALNGKRASVIDKAAAVTGVCRPVPGEGTAFNGRICAITQINRAAVARCRTVFYGRVFNGERPAVHVDRAATGIAFHAVLHDAVFYIQRSAANIKHAVAR